MRGEDVIPAPLTSGALVPPPRLPPIGLGTDEISPDSPGRPHRHEDDDEDISVVRMPFRVLAGILSPCLMGVGATLLFIGIRGVDLVIALTGPMELVVGGLFGYVAWYGHPPTPLEERRFFLKAQGMRRIMNGRKSSDR